MGDVEEALSLVRNELTVLPRGHPDRYTALNELAMILHIRFDQSHRMRDLEEAISTYREALTLLPPGHTPDSSFNLPNALHARFEQSGRMEDLEEAISLHREALALGHPDRAMSLNHLASALRTRFNQSGRMEDLEEAISTHRKVLALRPRGHPDRATSVENLANALNTRFNHSGKIKDLEDAVLNYREALALRRRGQSQCSSTLHNLASALHTRFNQSGRMEDLEEAISTHREAFILLSQGHPLHSMSLNNIANALLTRFKQSGNVEDLEEAISAYRKALTLFPDGHPLRSSVLIHLANTLRTQFKRSGRMEDLEDAISTHREAITLLPHGHPQRSPSLGNLANALRTRFNQSGGMEDLEEAVSIHREALTLCPHGHPDRPAALDGLSSSLITRFYQLNRMEDLEESISIHRGALALCPPGHPQRPASLDSLASSFITRFYQLGRMEDLEEAISAYRKALTLLPHGHPHRSATLCNLAKALLSRFMQSRRMEDLEEAISTHRESLSLLPLGHQHRSTSLCDLANALLSRFRQSGRTEDLEEAISTLRGTLTLQLHGDGQRSSSLNSFAIALLTCFEQSGRMGDLEDAISSLREAITLLPHGDPHRSTSLNNLATALLTRFKQSGRMEDLDESFALYNQAADDSTSTPREQLDAALHWVANARFYRHGSTLRAYSASLRLLDRCLNLHHNVDSQLKFLTTAPLPRSLASDAASAAIDVGDLKAAVELLERGRTILWSRMAKNRHPLDQLRRVNPGLADRIQGLTVELERLSLPSRSGSLDEERFMEPARSETQIRRNRILSDDLEKALREVREIEGFSDFLQAVPFKKLQAAAAEGPVILVNISTYRSDAIILHTVDDPPTLVSLPKVHRDLLIHVLQLVQAQKLDADVDRSKGIFPILRDLWNDIVSPVVDCLAGMGIPENGRVWWCPTSTLCALPLHAAGPYDGKHKNLPDIYISSYTPTLSALIRARADTGTLPYSQPVFPKLLIIGQPGESLPNVQSEIDNIRQLGEFVDVIVGPEAIRDNVLHGLQHHSWAHFACHGRLGPVSQPFDAVFELHGGQSLSLLDLIQARLPNAELAFLSACHSAAGDIATPDETIHLAAALQFCGFRSVVGTLWAMDDRDGPVVSTEFYKYMFRKPGNEVDFRDSAEALSVAVRAMRKSGVPLERWILFVHIGA